MGSYGAAAGSPLQAFGQLQQGQQNAGIANYNATVANQQTEVVEAQGAAEMQKSLINSNKMLGAGTAAYGAAGVGAGGSSSDVLRAGAQQGALNALTIKNNADIKATAYTNEAALDHFRAVNDITASQEAAAYTMISAGGGAFASSQRSGGNNPSDNTDTSESDSE